MESKKSIGDLAKELGISRTTISFVLNGKGDEYKISESTQKRVLDLVKKWNYRPNTAARNLRLGKTHAIGFIVPDVSNPFFAMMARMLGEYASNHGYHVMFGSTDGIVLQEAEIIDRMRQSVDGILMASADVNSEAVRKLVNSNYPLVLFDRVNVDPAMEVCTIGVENRYGMARVVQHIINKGCRRIGLLTLNPYLDVIQQRIEGYKSALIEAGLPVDEKLIREAPYNNLKQGVVEELGFLLSLDDPVDGVAFANNTLAAHGVWTVNMFHKDRVRSLEFVTFDDLPLFDYSIPPVSAVAQPSQRLMETGFEMLQRRIDSPEEPCEHVVLKPRFVLH